MQICHRNVPDRYDWVSDNNNVTRVSVASFKSFVEMLFSAIYQGVYLNFSFEARLCASQSVLAKAMSIDISSRDA